MTIPERLERLWKAWPEARPMSAIGAPLRWIGVWCWSTGEKTASVFEEREALALAHDALEEAAFKIGLGEVHWSWEGDGGQWYIGIEHSVKTTYSGRGPTRLEALLSAVEAWKGIR